MPTASEEVVRVAEPVESSMAVPIVDAPSLNVTLPVGVPAVELTLAVNVTACPNTDGFWEDARVVVVVALVTVNRAAFVVADPEELVKTARYRFPLCERLVVKLSVVEVAPGTSLKVAPPSLLTCHCTVGTGVPFAAALNDAV